MHVHLPNIDHRIAARTITKHRKFGKRQAIKGLSPVVEFECAGGCGKTVRVRASKMGPGNLFICGDRHTRDACLSTFPRAIEGRVRVEHHQSAGHMTGLTWEDKGRRAALKATIKDAGTGLARFLGLVR